MNEDQPKNTEWLFSKEWALVESPPALVTPVLLMNVSIVELQTCIELHERLAISNHSQYDHEGALLHRARGSYFRQQLAAMTPQMQTLEGRDAA